MTLPESLWAHNFLAGFYWMCGDSKCSLGGSYKDIMNFADEKIKHTNRDDINLLEFKLASTKCTLYTD